MMKATKAIHAQVGTSTFLSLTSGYLIGPTAEGLSRPVEAGDTGPSSMVTRAVMTKSPVRDTPLRNLSTVADTHS